MSTIGLNELGYYQRLYMLAFDHRGSFEKMVGDVELVPGAKTLIWEGFVHAVEGGAPKELAGILVDAKYGPDVARAAKAGGYKLAMPAEKSGQNEFDFEDGEQFGEKIEEWDPDFTKVLVRYNPEGDQEMNERQTARLLRLSEWLHEHHRKFLFELLVPAEDAQLASVDGSEERYDLDRVLRTDDLVQSDNVFVSATGVTTGALLRGIRYVNDGAITDSIVMRSRSGTVRRIEARHQLSTLTHFTGREY
jgi:hypothetical protein